MAARPTRPSELAERALALLREGLAHGRVSIGEIAPRLGLSERALRRELMALGTNYRILLDRARRETALHQASACAASGKQLAAQLGFTEPRAFYRAFRRWTGMSLSTYRATRGNDDATAAGVEFIPPSASTALQRESE
jgi:AraC-like DNA-binding protein